MVDQHAPSRDVAPLARIPSLDGLRAVSIFLVMGLHTLQRSNINHHVAWEWYGVFNGTGVEVFFVISGYLITSLLLREHRSKGKIGLSGFYMRRAFRILPPLYAYVGVLLMLAALGKLYLNKLDVLSALFFFHNYASTGSGWALEHFWSLSVEEQFYFLWPFVLIACLAPGGDRGRILAARVSLAVIALSPVMRVLSFRAANRYFHNGTLFHLAADTLMFGCLVAVLQGTPTFERIYAATTRLWVLPPAVIIISTFLEARFQNYWYLPCGKTLTGASIAMFMLWSIRNPRSVVGLVLNNRLVAWIGVLSYSLYLWQTFFLHAASIGVFGGETIFNTFPGNWIACLAVACCSYYLVERPALRLRLRLRSRPRTAATRNLSIENISS